ncbi:MAG: PfkB family carbohydrate kinase [Firmicutes bacterium]|nr:PfkB family carbohydrate kinase [Bacillota bacterium]
MRIIGIGDNVVDRYINNRIMFPGGNAVNFVVYAKKLGADAAYMGFIANDKEGRLVKESLESMDIDVSISPLVDGLATERCDVVLNDGDRVFQGCTYGEGEWKPFTMNDDQVKLLSEYDVVHCGCYANMEDEIYKLKDVDAIRTYDFSAEDEYRTEEYLDKVCPYIDIALFSAEEMNDDEILDLQKKVYDKGPKLVLVTNGKKGQKLWDGKNQYDGVVKLVEAVDTMGAGDSFFTAFVVTLAGKGKALDELSEADYNDAFAKAANFSAEICLVDGAFGFGTKYED